MNTSQLASTHPEISDARLRLAVAAYLARYKGQSRVHTDPTSQLSALVPRPVTCTR